MEKNSSTYNNKRFAQRTDNYADYERNTSIPVPPARAQNWIDFMALGSGGFLKEEGGEEVYYPNSISNAKSFIENSIYKNDSKFTEEINKFMSYMKMLNNGNDAKSDQPKVSWLGKNRAPKDQYDEFTNWSQSERQKYSSRFETMIGTKRGAILQKALVALKNAEIAAAKYSFPNDPGVKGAEFTSEEKSSGPSSGPSSTTSPNKPSSPESKPGSSSAGVSGSGSVGEQKPQKTYEKFNYSYIPFIKKIKTENDLLFFAAMQALGIKISQYNKANESSYYSKENHNKIQAEINKIAGSEYLNKINPALASLKQKALDKLFDKVGGADVKPPTETPNEQTGPLHTTHDEQGQTHFESPTRTEQGDKIRELFDSAYQIEREDPSQHKSLWKNIRIQIISMLKSNELDPKERIEFEDKIKDLDLKYNLAFHPEGGQQLSSGAFVVNTPEALARILRASLAADDVTTANDAIDKLKLIFEENSSYVPYQEMRTQLAQEINRYNFGKDETVNKL